MKKLLALLAALLMVFSLVGCSNNEPTTGSTDVKEVNVGVSIYKFDDNFMTLYRQEIEAYFETLNSDTVKYNVTVQDGKGDMAEQTNQIDNFIAQNYDVLIINLLLPNLDGLSILKYLNEKIIHLSISIECKTPKISPKIEDMRKNIARILNVSENSVGITATTGEGLTEFGKGNGISVFSVITVE